MQDKKAWCINGWMMDAWSVDHVFLLFCWWSSGNWGSTGHRASDSHFPQDLLGLFCIQLHNMYNVSTLSPQDPPRSTKMNWNRSSEVQFKWFFQRWVRLHQAQPAEWARRPQEITEIEAAMAAGEVICRIHFNVKNKTQNKNGSKWFKMIWNRVFILFVSFGVIQHCSLHTGTVDKWSKKSSEQNELRLSYGPKPFFLVSSIHCQLARFQIELEPIVELFSTLLSFSSGYWATLSMCTDLHWLALHCTKILRVLPCFAMFCQCFWARPDRYDRKGVTEQLRYGGVLQAWPAMIDLSAVIDKGA